MTKKKVGLLELTWITIRDSIIDFKNWVMRLFRSLKKQIRYRFFPTRKQKVVKNTKSFFQKTKSFFFGKPASLSTKIIKSVQSTLDDIGDFMTDSFERFRKKLPNFHAQGSKKNSMSAENLKANRGKQASTIANKYGINVGKSWKERRRQHK